VVSKIIHLLLAMLAPQVRSSSSSSAGKRNNLTWPACLVCGSMTQTLDWNGQARHANNSMNDLILPIYTHHSTHFAPWCHCPRACYGKHIIQKGVCAAAPAGAPAVPHSGGTGPHLHEPR
jgi:hypothetical protein